VNCSSFRNTRVPAPRILKIAALLKASSVLYSGFADAPVIVTDLSITKGSAKEPQVVESKRIRSVKLTVPPEGAFWRAVRKVTQSRFAGMGTVPLYPGQPDEKDGRSCSAWVGSLLERIVECFQSW
jgi:hypothetical protein